MRMGQGSMLSVMFVLALRLYTDGEACAEHLHVHRSAVESHE